MACGWNGQGSLRPDLQGWGVDSEESQDQTLLSGTGLCALKVEGKWSSQHSASAPRNVVKGGHWPGRA